MTVWRAGMLAVCVDDLPGEKTQPALKPRKGEVVRVFKVITGRRAGKVGLIFFDKDACPYRGFDADYFRPLIDRPDDTALIERIKRCKPVRQPVVAR